MENLRVQLRVRSSNLQVGRGLSGKVFRTAHEIRYLIGSSDDAFLCCRHPEIKPYHCWIVVHQHHGVEVRKAEADVAVNGIVIADRQQLSPGDVLRVGPLQLEVHFPTAHPAPEALQAATIDPVEDKISDWLIDQDAAERERRKKDRTLRHYDQPDSGTVGTAATEAAEPASTTKQAEPARPQRKKPGKLPARPPTGPSTPTSDAAAEGALKRIFTGLGAVKKGREPEKP